MRVLAAAGWHTITAGELAADLAAGIRAPPRTFVITFDDGYDDGDTHVLPILETCDFTATFFVVAGRIGARKHEPAISFTDIASDPARCANITDFARFDPAAADFELIVPNMCNDMNECPVATGDAFLASFVPRIRESPAFAGSVLFITWDEGTSGARGGGHVATIVFSRTVEPGTVSSIRHDHYSLLRTIEDARGLGCLGRSCSANDLGELFGG